MPVLFPFFLTASPWLPAMQAFLDAKPQGTGRALEERLDLRIGPLAVPGDERYDSSDASRQSRVT